MAENLGSFSFDVTKRILCTLFNDGSVKKTTLATKTRLNYNVCLRYIQMLKVLGWIKVSSEVSITETGRNVMKRLLNQPSSDFQNNSSYDMSSNSSTLESGKKLDQAITDNQNIMVVDDEPDVLLTYESFLSYAGFKVSTFADSYEALRDFDDMTRLNRPMRSDIRIEILNCSRVVAQRDPQSPSPTSVFHDDLDGAA